jgi:hypothetical protein
MSYRIRFASLAAIFALALGAPASVSAQSASLPEVAWQQATLYMLEGAQVQLAIIVAWRTVDGVRVANGPITIPYTVSGNATAGIDYRLEAAGTVVFEDGREYAPLRIAIVDDDQHEPAPDTLYIHLTPRRPPA